VYADKLIKDTIHHHCSDIGVPAMNGRPAYVSQNMDLDDWMDGYQIVLHIQRHGSTSEQYVLSCAGLVALNGMNENGIGVCVNTLMQLQASSNGLPVAFVVRGLLEKKNNKEVLNFIQATKHASGQNYTIGIVDSVYDFEASANKVVRLYPDASGIVYHTNHPVVNDDVKPWYKDYYQKFLAGTTKNMNSEIRFATLKRRANETIDKDDMFIKTTLRSKDDNKNPVCRTRVPSKLGFTFGSVILTLSGKRMMQVTAGPPDESEYQTFSFKK
jgi:isopenicillin-N N-acyltransferase like protein